MSVQPKITIITASYNYARYISQTIESVIKQTYTNWEMIIVDDGSKDNSVEIINSYCQKDTRIKLYQHKNHENKGLKDTLKLAIKHTNSDWIAFLESDDMLTSDYLETKIKIIQDNPDVKFIFNDYAAIGNTDFQKESHYKIFSKKMSTRSGFYDYQNDFYRDNPVPTFSVVMLKTELLKNIDYNSPIQPYLDWFLWGQISKKTQFYYINKRLTLWRKHPASYINRTNKFKNFLFFLKLGLYLPQIYKRKIMRFWIVFKIS